MFNVCFKRCLTLNDSLFSVSVVIPTLGGESLSKTIASINSGSLVPTEILICIPEKYISRVNAITDTNVRVIITPFMGQVAQRAEGFRQAKEDLVIQLDDDIFLDSDCLAIISKSLLSLGRGNIVGPAIYSSATKEPLTRFNTGVRGFADSLYASFVGGLPWGLRRMGALSNIGACGSVDPRHCGLELFPTDWLPGGCSISFRDDLILEDFYPIKGKAYSEDLLHSHYRSQKGIKHYVATLSKVTIDPPHKGINISSAAELRARYYVVRALGGNIIRANFLSLMDIIKRQIASILLC